MARALTAVMDGVEGCRRTLPHLSALEISLGRNGLASVENASYAVLLKVSQQLASLTDDRHHPDLRGLQDCLLAAMARKRPPPPNAQLEDLGGGGIVEVTEITHSAFMAIANASTLPAAAGTSGPTEGSAAPAFPVDALDDSPPVLIPELKLTWPDSTGHPESRTDAPGAIPPPERTLPLATWEATLPFGAPGT